MARGRPSKKSHIIDTALTLFSRLGYQGTSIDQVVVAAGVSKPTVYSNFSSKQILWNQALERILETAEKDLQKLDSPQKKPIDQWLSAWYLWLEDSNRLAVYRIMLGESHKMELMSFELFKQLEGLFDQALDTLLDGQDNTLSAAQIYVLKATSKEALLMPNLYSSQALTDPESINLSPELKALLNSLLYQD
jgi:AcrR family transcriptional regulator